MLVKYINEVKKLKTYLKNNQAYFEAITNSKTATLRPLSDLISGLNNFVTNQIAGNKENDQVSSFWKQIEISDQIDCLMTNLNELITFNNLTTINDHSYWPYPNPNQRAWNYQLRSQLPIVSFYYHENLPDSSQFSFKLAADPDLPPFINIYHHFDLTDQGEADISINDPTLRDQITNTAVDLSTLNNHHYLEPKLLHLFKKTIVDTTPLVKNYFKTRQAQIDQTKVLNLIIYSQINGRIVTNNPYDKLTISTFLTIVENDFNFDFIYYYAADSNIYHANQIAKIEPDRIGSKIIDKYSPYRFKISDNFYWIWPGQIIQANQNQNYYFLIDNFQIRGFKFFKDSANRPKLTFNEMQDHLLFKLDPKQSLQANFNQYLALISSEKARIYHNEQLEWLVQPQLYDQLLLNKRNWKTIGMQGYQQVSAAQIAKIFKNPDKQITKPTTNTLT